MIWWRKNGAEHCFCRAFSPAIEPYRPIMKRSWHLERIKMIIEHNSRNPLYRIPFGAVPCLSTVVLRLFAKTDEIPRGISLVYAFGSNKPSTLPMHYAYSIARGSLYET